MLLKFKLQNCLSFFRPCTLDMEASSVRQLNDYVFTPLNRRWDVKVLKSVAIYGANASGKSNMLKGFAFMKYFVLNSFNDANKPNAHSISPFLLNTKSINEPSAFEVTFIYNEIKYRYGFEVFNKEVQSEWLFYAEPRVRENNLFTRTKQEFRYSKTWNKEIKGQADLLISNFTKSNVLFITVLGQFNIEIGSNIINWFNNCLIGFDLNNDFYIHNTASLLKNEEYSRKIHLLIQEAHLGFTSIDARIVDKYKVNDKYSVEFLLLALSNELDKYEIRTKHEIFNEKGKLSSTTFFDLFTQESIGTQKFIALIGSLIVGLKNKSVLFIDELDARLHPLLLETIVKFFSSSKHNPLGAQLIFTTHSTHLLKRKIRRDQIFTVERNKYGESILKGIHGEDKNIRTDASYEKEYLAGKYGGVPKLNPNNLQLDLFDE